jgi:hypothetical protein
MNLEFLKTDSPIFWEGVKLGLMISSFTQKQKVDLMLTERQAALKFGMTSKQFRGAFVVCKNPKIAPVIISVPNRKKVFRKYMLSDIEALIGIHKNSFNWDEYQARKKSKNYFH